MRGAVPGVLAALLALAPVLRAGAETDAPSPEKPPFVFDVGWDDGPTYQIAQRLPGLIAYPWAEPARERVRRYSTPVASKRSKPAI